MLRYSAGRYSTALFLCGLSTSALAFRFEFAGVEGSLANLFTVGAHMRMQDPAQNLIGKSNLNSNLCSTDRCIGLMDAGATAEQLEFIRAPGAYSLNGDNGNLNYDRNDVVSAAMKYTADLSMSYQDYGLFARGLFLYDPVNVNFNERRTNLASGPALNQRGPASVRRSNATVEDLGTNSELYDAYIFGKNTIGNYDVSWRLGQQLINWGESTFLVLNSINSINPPSESRLFTPGFDLKEIFTPIPAAYFNTQLTDSLSMEGFYQFGWRGIEAAGAGGFFSTTDLNVPGGNYDDRNGNYAALLLGSNAEDPLQLERLQGPAGVVQTLGLTNTSITILRTQDRTPSDTGQYGLSFKFLSETLNSTQFGLFYLNYHSRLPIASAIAAHRSCLRTVDRNQPKPNAAQIATCTPATNPAIMGMSKEERYAAGFDGLPGDSINIVLEYPENIQLYGFSFNTNVGDFAIQGEYAFRTNLPVQVDLEDVIFAASQPAFPRVNINLPADAAGVMVPGVTLPAAGITVPGARVSSPDFIETVFRKNPDVLPRSFIRGYESLKVGQFDVAATYVLGPGNFMGADQWILLGEAGFTHIVDMPKQSEGAFFEGPGTNTHPTPGRLELNSQLPLNPVQQRGGFVTPFSWGYRILSILSYKGLPGGLELQPQTTFFHDVNGVGPGPAQNFVEGRKEVNMTMNLSKGSFKVAGGYTWFFGGAERNLRRDRDFATLAARYEF
jgi:hypothetical protein